MRDLLNAARKTTFGNGGSAMLQPFGSKRRIEKNVSTGSRHKMNRKEYKMIMGYLKDPEHLAEILGSGRKTKISGKHPSKQTTFGVMAVHLASLGFPVCTSAIMQKKFDKYLASFKKAREWSMSTGVGLTEEEVTRGMTIKDKLNKKCPFYHRMYAIFGHRANIVPPAIAEDGLPPELEVEEDSLVPITFLDSQVTIEISEQQFDLPIENQFVFQMIGNEGGSNVEGDEITMQKKEARMWKGMKLSMQKLKTSTRSLEMTEVHLMMKREGGRKKSLNFQRAVQNLEHSISSMFSRLLWSDHVEQHHLRNRQMNKDVKSANILLIEKLEVNVADFGISKLAPAEAREATHFFTVAVQGTIGYIDPEYYTSFQLNAKSDVYSFGVVLLELISAQPAINFQRPGAEASLIMYATPLIQKGELDTLIDPVLIASADLQTRESMTNVGNLALQCFEGRSKVRPDMREVWTELQTIWNAFGGGVELKEANSVCVPRESFNISNGSSSLLSDTTQFKVASPKPR
ncbi:hypothetical protein R1flu_012846 [Riccia fluitans]|uniref:Protein kinase domain-containing protein n=1 Tax=Riccia fluitans TaxID=41844 RepID=A0ABD1ZE85_9MARC